MADLRQKKKKKKPPVNRAQVWGFQNKRKSSHEMCILVVRYIKSILQKF